MSKLNKEQIIALLDQAQAAMCELYAEGLSDEAAPDRPSQCLIDIENKIELADAIDHVAVAISKLGGVI